MLRDDAVFPPGHSRAGTGGSDIADPVHRRLAQCTLHGGRFWWDTPPDPVHSTAYAQPDHNERDDIFHILKLMTKKLTVSDRTAEQLAEHKRDGETPGTVIRRLLGETEDAGTSGGGDEQLAPDDLTTLDGEPLTDANDLALEVMNGRDVVHGAEEQLSPRECVAARRGVDPADYSTADELREAIRVRETEEGN